LIGRPAVRRKGEPDGGAEAALAESKRSGKRTVAPIASMALGLHRRNDGVLILVHLDPDLESGSGGMHATALRYYLTLVRPDLAAACIDAPVPMISLFSGFSNTGAGLGAWLGGNDDGGPAQAGFNICSGAGHSCHSYLASFLGTGWDGSRCRRSN